MQIDEEARRVHHLLLQAQDHVTTIMKRVNAFHHQGKISDAERIEIACSFGRIIAALSHLRDELSHDTPEEEGVP